MCRLKRYKDAEHEQHALKDAAPNTVSQMKQRDAATGVNGTAAATTGSGDYVQYVFCLKSVHQGREAVTSIT